MNPSAPLTNLNLVEIWNFHIDGLIWSKSNHTQAPGSDWFPLGGDSILCSFELTLPHVAYNDFSTQVLWVMGYRDFIAQGANATVLTLTFICGRTVSQVTLGSGTLWPAELGRASAFNNTWDSQGTNPYTPLEQATALGVEFL